MNDWTPTIDDIRYAYVEDPWFRTKSMLNERELAQVTTERMLEAFDRWLAAHDREVAEKAWDEGYCDGTQDGSIIGVGRTGNPYQER